MRNRLHIHRGRQGRHTLRWRLRIVGEPAKRRHSAQYFRLKNMIFWRNHTGWMACWPTSPLSPGLRPRLLLLLLPNTSSSALTRLERDTLALFAWYASFATERALDSRFLPLRQVFSCLVKPPRSVKVRPHIHVFVRVVSDIAEMSLAKVESVSLSMKL